MAQASMPFRFFPGASNSSARSIIQLTSKIQAHQIATETIGNEVPDLASR